MDLSQLLKGEGFTVEYKKCSSSLSNSVFETVCSFSNRYGGHILLGVDDDATVIGVNEDSFTKIYSNCEPTLEEGDVFKTTIPLIQKEQETINVPQNVLQNVPQNTELKDHIFELIKHNPKITRQNIAEILNINIKTVARKLKQLPNVHYIGSAKNGHWEIF